MFHVIGPYKLLLRMASAVLHAADTLDSTRTAGGCLLLHWLLVASTEKKKDVTPPVPSSSSVLSSFLLFISRVPVHRDQPKVCILLVSENTEYLPTATTT